MSAQQYGARLLEEVQEESLENLLADLRHIVNPTPDSGLGIPQLDEVLESIWPGANQPRPQAQPQLDDARQHRGWIRPADTGTHRDRGNLPLNQDAGDENENAGPGPRPLAIDSDNAQDSDDDFVDAQRHHPPQTPSRQAIPKPKFDPPATTMEISSPKSATGKTTLLYYLCAIATLPVESGGKGSTVVYIDSDGRFSASRLMQVMKHYIATSKQKQTTTTPGDVGSHSLSNNNHKGKSKDPNPSRDNDKLNSVNINTTSDRNHVNESESESESDVNSIALEALQHIHVFRPQSSKQVMTILQSLPEFLFDRSKIQSSVYRHLGLLVLDSATAFYWQDRFDRDMARLGGTESSGMPAAAEKPTGTTTSGIIECLKSLQRRFDCVVAFTTTNYSTTTSTAPSTAPTSGPAATGVGDRRGHDTQPAPAPETKPVSTTQWSTYTTLTLDLSRIAVPQFPPQLTLSECLADADKRFAAMRNTRIQIRVRGPPGGVPVVLKTTDEGVDIEST
ncbi:hypothetical protein ABEF93_008116 [Exophiala dermatitidis]